MTNPDTSGQLVDRDSRAQSDAKRGEFEKKVNLLQIIQNYSSNKK